MHDKRFKDLAFTLETAVDMIWDKAVKIVSAYAATRAQSRVTAPKKKDTSLLEAAGVLEQLKRLNQIVKKKRKPNPKAAGKGDQPAKFDGKCWNCD